MKWIFNGSQWLLAIFFALVFEFNRLSLSESRAASASDHYRGNQDGFGDPAAKRSRRPVQRLALPCRDSSACLIAGNHCTCRPRFPSLLQARWSSTFSVFLASRIVVW
ncbi:hypothetical protein PIB30_032622 [Stylosanthes scabra]|uniref:Secreted protein n=1 Tax=Stylosanthes scabra TaxID=79078 RepID=A0ABU6UBM6_9FABA|nr:hypothetical protein [Stylosanthes scabra]